MLRIILAVLLLSLSAVALAQNTASKNSELSGEWVLIEQFKDETHAHRMSLAVDGNKITGKSGPSKIEGDISDSAITLKWLSADGSRVDATYTGKAQNGELKGEGVWRDAKLAWSAHRPAVRAGGPSTHTFTPTEFHHVFSWNIPPALRIFPGDTVKTKSVDAGGTDENSVQRSM